MYSFCREVHEGCLPHNKSDSIDYKIIFTDVLLPSAESFKKDCCQLQAKVCAKSTGNLVQACPGKKCG